MTELKTLKDMQGVELDQFKRWNSDILRLILPSELRQEAIKWVKQHRNIKPRWAKETNEEFFMAFFNITEEELK